MLALPACRSSLFRPSRPFFFEGLSSAKSSQEEEVTVHRSFSSFIDLRARRDLTTHSLIRVPRLFHGALSLHRSFATVAGSEAPSQKSEDSRRRDFDRMSKRVKRSRRLLLATVFLISGAIGMFRFVWLWEPEEKRNGKGAPVLPRDTFHLRIVRLDGLDSDEAFGRSAYLCVEELGEGKHPVFLIADSWPVVQADKGRAELAELATAQNCRLVVVYRPGCGQSGLPEGATATLADWATTVEQLADRMYGNERVFSVIGCGRVEGWYALACAAGIRPERLSSVHLLGRAQANASLGEATTFNRLMARLVYKFWRRRLYSDPEEGIRQYLSRMSEEEATLLGKHKDIVEILLKQGLYDGVDDTLASMELVYWTPRGFDAWSSAGAPIHFWSPSTENPSDLPSHVLLHPSSHCSGLGILAEDLGAVLQAIIGAQEEKPNVA